MNNLEARKSALLGGPNIVQDGLLALWEHRTGTGTKVKERIGGKDGTIQGDSSQFWQSNPVSGYYRAVVPNFLNGIGTGLAIPSGGISIVAAYSPGSVGGGSRGLISKSYLNGGSGLANWVLDSTGDEIRFWFGSGAATYQVWETTALNISLDPATWHIFAVSYTFGTGSSLVFYDGITPIAGSWTTGNGNVGPDATNQYVHLGAMASELDDTSVLYPLQALLGDVLLYNKALSLAEVKKNFYAMRGRYSL